ncbi:hypothetical protein [Ignavibacterium sp.]|uniref:hypothetical protein n=1 Tax=Ignavibacterium sp. TaxID=2651167 RepID=UPI0021FBC7E5|nr:hypothetical protein [Ignavibacterium sp.]BDQ02994.1 MAG: hypothetical protein KatS3mg037_1569 [Ignavibacterium sp.]
MNGKSILIIILAITCEVYSQTNLAYDSNNTITERLLSSYFTVGVGRTSKYLNFGAGLFFPLEKSILIGLRANINTELDAFPGKVPLENIWDINLTVEYVPLISERIILLVGGGAGYSRAAKRGDFIGYKLVTAEYEEIYSSSISFLGEMEFSLLITENLGINIIGYTLYADNRTFLNYQLGIFLCKILELQ